MFRQGLEDFPAINDRLRRWDEQITNLKFEPDAFSEAKKTLFAIADEVRY